MKIKLLKRLRKKAEDKFFIIETFDCGLNYEKYYILEERKFLIFSKTLDVSYDLEQISKIMTLCKRCFIEKEIEKLKEKYEA